MLLRVLSVHYQISPERVLAVMGDRASVNDVAIRSLQVLCTSIQDIGCFSHTLDHVGSHFSCDALKSFVNDWVQIFSHSPKCRLVWQTRTGMSIKTYCKTRWWSKHRVMEQVMTMFGDVVGFSSTMVMKPPVALSGVVCTTESITYSSGLSCRLNSLPGWNLGSLLPRLQYLPTRR